MRPSRRLVSATAVTVCIALGSSGCGFGDAPRPGVAAEVEGTTLRVAELGDLLDGVCLSTEATEGATATTRAYAETQLLQQWVSSQLVLAYAEEHDLSTAAPDSRPETVPGWEDMDSGQRDAVTDYLEERNAANAALAALNETQPDPSDFDVVINPRYDLAVVEDDFVPTDEQLSIAVSDDALTLDDTGEVDEAALAELPDNELCGARPDPAAHSSGIPVPQG